MGKAKLNIPMCAAAVLLFLTLLSIHLTSGLFARYTTTVTAGDSARVAKFDVDVTADINDITVDCAQSDSGTFILTVTNNSEVAVNYVIKIKQPGSVDGTDLYLTKDDEKDQTGQLWKFTPDENNVYTFTIKEKLDPVGGTTCQREHKFSFGVYSWHTVTEDANNSPPTYNWDLDFNVDVVATQVD